MTGLFIGGLIALAGILIFGRFTVGIGDSVRNDDGWKLTRRDNPRGYWLGVAAIAVCVAVFGVIVAANHGIKFDWSIFKL